MHDEIGGWRRNAQDNQNHRLVAKVSVLVTLYQPMTMMGGVLRSNPKTDNCSPSIENSVGNCGET